MVAIVAIIMAIVPFNAFASKIEKSDLEKMSVKELKELRDSINEILGDDGESSKEEFGSLTGTLTYFYNDFKGNVADADSSVVLVSKDLKNADINTDDLYDFEIGAKYTDPEFGEGVFFTHVGGTGTYTIGHIPAGEYRVLLVSGQTTCEQWFDATSDDGETDPSYYEGIGSGFAGLIDEEDATKIGEAVNVHKYTFEDVTIYAGESTTLDYDFGMTYA